MAYQSAISTLDGLLQQSCGKQEYQDYWNIDDILAEEEIVPSQFKRDAKGLGYLDQLDTQLKQKHNKLNGINRDTIQANQKISLPLWLAIALAQREIIELKTPQYMTQQYFNILKADSHVVNMREKSQYIYENVMKICSHLTEEFTHESIRVYQDMFIQRFLRMVLDHSNSSNSAEQFSSMTKRLTNIEIEMFNLHRRQYRQFQQWMNKETKEVEINQELIKMTSIDSTNLNKKRLKTK